MKGYRILAAGRELWTGPDLLAGLAQLRRLGPPGAVLYSPAGVALATTPDEEGYAVLRSTPGGRRPKLPGPGHDWTWIQVGTGEPRCRRCGGWGRGTLGVGCRLRRCFECHRAPAVVRLREHDRPRYYCAGCRRQEHDASIYASGEACGGDQGIP